MSNKEQLFEECLKKACEMLLKEKVDYYSALDEKSRVHKPSRKYKRWYKSIIKDLKAGKLTPVQIDQKYTFKKYHINI